MKNFVFSLERMRSYKEQLLDKEKNALAQLRRKRGAIADNISQLQRYRAIKSSEMKERQAQGIEAAELSSYRFYMENTRLQLEDLDKQLKIADMEVERQLQIVVAASREVAGLDKLEEKQLEEYRVLETRDFNLQIEEHVVTGMVRQKRARV